MNIVLQNAYGRLMIGFLSKVSMCDAAFQNYLNFKNKMLLNVDWRTILGKNDV